jgi:hypothetical protein
MANATEVSGFFNTYKKTRKSETFFQWPYIGQRILDEKRKRKYNAVYDIAYFV